MIEDKDLSFDTCDILHFFLFLFILQNVLENYIFPAESSPIIFFSHLNLHDRQDIVILM